MRRYEAYYLDRDLPSDGQRVDLRGSLAAVQWPPYCVNCGAPSSSRLTVRKIFRRKYSSKAPWRYVIRQARMPYCESCTAQHRKIADGERMSIGERLFHLFVTPLVIPVVGGLFFANLIYRTTNWRTESAAARQWSLVVIALLLLPVVISVIASWRATRFYLVPRLDEIIRACDYSDELGGFFVGRHRAFVFRNRDYVTAFMAANHDRVWTETDTARTNRRQMAYTVAVIIGLGVAWLWLRPGRP
jgi:hypothetical protein